MKNNDKVVAEVAEAELERWADLLELDISGDGLDDEDFKGLQDFKTKFITRVRQGALTVDDEGVLKFSPTPKNGDPITLTFDEPDGALLSVRQKKDDDLQATRRMLAQWTGVAPVRLGDLKLRDFNFCASLLAFFGNS